MLAKLEMKVLLQELLRRFTQVKRGGTVERTPATLVRGVKTLPLVFS